MPYDQNATYQPPPRAYYSQPQHSPIPPAPVGRQAHNGYLQQNDYSDYAHGPGDRYERRDTQEQFSAYGQQQFAGHAQGHAQDSGYVDQAQRNGRAPKPVYQDPYVQEAAQRQPDPRYARQARPAPQSSGSSEPRRQHPSQRAGYQVAPQHTPAPRQQPSRGDLGNGNKHVENRRRETELQAADMVAPAQPWQDQRQASPSPARRAKQASDPRNKPAKDDWKEREKAKMRATEPEFLPQDTAFPIFPLKNKEKLRPDDRSGVTSAMSRRSSEDHGTPSTNSSHNKPVMSPDNSYSNDIAAPRDHLAPQRRPSPQHQPFSFDPPLTRKPPAPQPELVQQKITDNYREVPQQNHTSPIETRAPQQWAIGNQQHNGRPLDPPRNFSHGQDGQYDQQPARVQSPAQQERRAPPARGMPPAQAFDTHAAPPRQPAYIDHQSLSPTYAPPRPSTAQARREMQDAAISPISEYSAPPKSAATKPWHEQRGEQESLGNIYSDYYDETASAATPVSALDEHREAQIESEMPDFDSAAPGQKLRKPSAAAESAAVGPPVQSQPMQHPNQSVQSLPPTRQRFYQQQEPRAVAQPDFDTPKEQQKGGITESFVFGLPGESQQQYRPMDPYTQRNNIAYREGPLHEQPPPIINGNFPPPRRSMDDSRRPPNWQGGPPQPQRFHPNGQPMSRQIRPPDRPGLDRNATNMTAVTAQSAWTDPGPGQRAPSAPPLRQGSQRPPDANGAPPSQQRSAPQQRSVPQQQQLYSNPDALPHHPAPVRPGLMESMSPPQPPKPAPVRQYDRAGSGSQPQPQSRGSIDGTARPVTHAELDQLRAAVSANPANNKASLRLGKKLVEASSVLASEGGRLDAKTTARNREKYIFDAHKRIKKLASAGYPDAQFYLADSYGQGSLGLEVDTREAFNLYQAAAKQGHAAAAYRTAVCCEMGPEEGGGTRRDPPKAVQWYRRAAALGDVAAMYKLGMVLLKGLLGQPKNIGESVTWLKRAAERADKNNPHALHELGLMHERGNKDPAVRDKIIPDETYSRELFLQAAGLGYKFSQFRLGQAYEYGNVGLPIDSRQSISYYSKAAAQGEHQAELALSGWYLTGAEGILEHSDTEAYLWARKAASSEPPLAKAMFAMGYFSETGIGCNASLEEARRWYGRAASYKFPKALERLEELKRGGGKGALRAAPANGKLTRKDQKRDEAECAVM